MTKNSSKKEANRGAAPEQLWLNFPRSDLMADLIRRIGALDHPAQKPLIRVNTVKPTSEPSTHTPRPKKQGTREGRIYRGRYVDMTGKFREVPDLHAITILGIASGKHALNPLIPLNAEDFRDIAITASAHRNKTGVGGPYICAQTAEFIVRILRRIQLTQEQLSILTDNEAQAAEDLLELVDKFIELHALDVEISSTLITTSGA
jgi:hypothetical protein